MSMQSLKDYVKFTNDVRKLSEQIKFDLTHENFQASLGPARALCQ